MLLIIILFLAAVALVVIFLSRRFSDDARKDTDKKLRSQKKLMTNNIAHELRTPVTSIRGYLETLMDNPSLPEEKRVLFTQRAYLQALRLSDLIRDISLVTKIEDAPEMITKAHIGIRKITEEVFDELGAAIKEKRLALIIKYRKECLSRAIIHWFTQYSAILWKIQSDTEARGFPFIWNARIVQTASSILFIPIQAPECPKNIWTKFSLAFTVFPKRIA